MVVVIDLGPDTRDMFDRRRHAALELVVVVAIEQVVFAIVLVLHHGLDRAQAFLEQPAFRLALLTCSIGIATPDEITLGEIGAVGPAFFVDQCLQARAIGAGLEPKTR